MFEIVQGLKFKADFHSKMSVCRHELGEVDTPPPAIPTLSVGLGPRGPTILVLLYMGVSDIGDIYFTSFILS